MSKSRLATRNSQQSKPETVSILHIEDSEADIYLISEQLNRSDRFHYAITNHRTLHSAQEEIKQQHYDVVFLDLSLPDSNGLETLQRFRECNRTVPIIVLTGSYDDELVAQLIQRGAQDYIHKDEFNIKTINRTIRYAIERKKTEVELEQLAHFDPLTKVCNRAIFMDRLKHALKNYTRQQGHVVVMLLDLDNFKKINDSLGHGVGDALLIQVSNRLRACVRDCDTVARLGGDEFTILLDSIEQLNALHPIANKILTALSEPFIIDGRTIKTSTSIGISSSFDNQGNSADSILKNSDTAMYNAKRKGGNGFSFFTRELQVSAQIRNNLEKNLKSAIENDELQIYFQPQINTSDNSIYGAEALVRWKHPRHGIIPPNGFIPALNETGLIVPATEWIIENSLKQWQKWMDAGTIDKNIHISINIPPQFFSQSNICFMLTEVCQRYKIHCSQVELELTEDTFMDFTPKNVDILNQIKADGFRLAIDDFGTGYSSLGYLKSFPIDCLKLDRLFIKDIIDSPKDEAIARAMAELCRNININLIAEGVDTKEKLVKLNALGCDIIQGFHFSKPLNNTDFETYLTNYKRRLSI